MHKKKPLVVAISHMLGAMLIAGAASAEEATQPVEKVTVTGSAIKRAQSEGPTPLEIVTREEIQKTGASNVNELLRSLPVVDIFDQGELASNSPAGSGTANIRMRGLDETNVLVLLNGRRLPVNALYDSSGAGAAVDVNSIPLGAIDRIEILKEGASAIYGADAVAGVVNFITKKDYQGTDVRVGYGISSEGDGKELSAGATAGFGNLEEDRYNFLVTVDYFKRDPIYRKDRDISKTANFSRFGGPDRRTVFAPEGNLLDDNFEFTGQTVRPCPADRLGPDGVCRYDFNASLLTAYNGADRLNGMLLGTFKLGSNTEAFAELMYTREEDHFEAHPVPDFFLTPEGQYYTGRFMQGGPRITDRQGDFFNFATGLEGTTEKFDWKVSVSHGVSKVINDDRNYYDVNLWNAAIEDGSFDPTVNTNDPALVESLKVTPYREGKSVITSVNGQIGGDIMKLAGGQLSYATGLSFYRESLTDTPDELSQAGEVVGSIQQSAVDASRSVRAAFLELSVPFHKHIETQLALRYDDYPDASNLSPKVAFKYQPSQSFALRASYAESFKAPALKQLYGGQEEGAITVTSDEDCVALGYDVGCQIPGVRVSGSNPDLAPEKGKTFNVGFIVEPVSWFNGSLDYWRIDKEDEVGTRTVSQAIQAGDWGRDPVTGELIVYQTLQNFASSMSDGIDLDLRFKIGKTPLGVLTLHNFTTYYFHIENQLGDDEPVIDYVDTYVNPRWRNVLSLSSAIGPWTNTLSLRSVAGFEDTDAPPAPAGTRSVDAHHELDFVGVYAGFKGWQINYGVKNLLNEEPPFSVTNVSSNDYTQMGFAELYSSRGRFYFASVSYSFQ
jgi:iron complex outermembrane receptor protein